MKKKCRWISIIVSISILLSGISSVNAETDLVSVALEEISFTKEMCTVSENAIDKTYGDDYFRLPFFNDQLRNPLETPSFFKNSVDFIIKNKNSLRNLNWFSSYRLGYMVAAYPQYEPDYTHRIIDSAPLLYAIADIYTLHQEPLPSYMFEALKEDLLSVPLDLQIELAKVLYASMEFELARDKAFSSTEKIKLVEAFRNPTAILTSDGFDDNTFSIASTVNYGQLYFASVILNKYLDQCMKNLHKISVPNDLNFSFDTPMGKIIFRDSKDNIFTQRNILLSLDAGGNDRYINSAGGNDSYFNPVSICIDMEGNDIYVSEDSNVFSQGAGVFGFGALIDFQGDDTYNNSQYGQGFGCFGIGILQDYQGDDTYNCDFLGQGAGVFGIGILNDIEGSDRYAAFSFGQGFGYVKGLGLLLDCAGDDVYVANDEDVSGSNPQSTDHNTSFCQGAGFGRRADLAEGNSMSGGIGLLIDIEGNDKYSCGVFGQGTGYWAGTGILYDGKGSDSYKGVWYVQGAAAHFGIALLMDVEGDDTYDALMNMAQGAGHDVSLGYLIDFSGDDIYTSPNLALGGGNANGLGFFVDANGSDKYQLRRKNATNLGKASCVAYPETSWRYGKLTLGVFIDRNGNDTYMTADENGEFTIPDERSGNDKTWSFIHDKVQNAFGCAVDSNGGSIHGLLPVIPKTEG
ncbi:MAG: hypothetical protein KAH01_06510 [Caldisericia bacterium]|nr:hypothetical protein [Caldisericia bacterium]